MARTHTPAYKAQVVKAISRSHAVQRAKYEAKLLETITAVLAPAMEATTLDEMRAALVPAGLALYRQARDVEKASRFRRRKRLEAAA